MAAHFVKQRGRQAQGFGLDRRLRARQFDPAAKSADAVHAREPRVFHETLQGRVERRGHRAAITCCRQCIRYINRRVAQHIHLGGARCGVGQQRQHALALGRGGRRHGGSFGARALRKCLQEQTVRCCPQAGRAGLGQCSQARGPLGGRHEPIFIHFPSVIGEQFPFIGAQLFGRIEGVGQHVAHGALARQTELQHLQHFARVGFAGQARPFLALRAEKQQGWVASHLEAGAKRLRTRAVAIDIHRHKCAGALDEIRPIEKCGLELIARRAPLRAPVQQNRLLLRLCKL